MYLKKITFVCLVFLLSAAILAGCTTKDPQDKTAIPPADNGQEQPADNDENKDKTALQIFFTRDNQGKIETVPVTREVVLDSEDTSVIAAKALELLYGGPSNNEKEQGLVNSLPEAKLLELTLERPHVILNFSKEFEQFGGTSRLHAVLEQLTWTMSSVPGIKSVILMIEGERVGTEKQPFTGEGALFNDLTIDPAAETAATLGPADTLDLFIAVIPEVEKMWALMGPNAKGVYGSAGNIEYTAFSEGLGSWKSYQVTEEKIEGDIAIVTIKGDQELEGQKQPNAVYTAYMVRENGQWKWDFPPDK
ncbi:MAG: GerMN domain-containing protein [Desulfotomaculaceae bacterium]